MALINSIQEVTNSGVQISFSTNSARLPDFAYYEQMYLVPVLGNALYTTISGNTVPNTHETLRLLARRASAALTYWHELPLQHANISDTGVFVTNNDNRTAAPRWAFEKVREALADKGLTAIELMLNELHSNATVYSWQAPEAYRNSCFVRAADFNVLIKLYQPFRTFDTLRPIVRQVEEEHLHSIMGESFYNSVLTNDTDEAKALLKLIRKAVAQLTLKAAIEQLPVRIGVQGITVYLRDNNDTPDQGRSNAPLEQLSVLHKAADINARAYLIDVVNYLNTTASNTVFQDYFNSSYYRSANANSNTIDNSTQNVFAL